MTSLYVCSRIEKLMNRFPKFFLQMSDFRFRLVSRLFTPRPSPDFLSLIEGVKVALRYQTMTFYPPYSKLY